MNQETIFDNITEQQPNGEAVQPLPEPEAIAITPEPEPVDTLAPAYTEADVERVEQLAKLHMAMRLTTLRITRPRDWVNLDGEPYLSAFGCQRLGPLYRMRFRDVRHEVVRHEDGTYTVVVTGRAASEVLDPNGWVEVVGAARSDDKFLTKGGRVTATFGDVLKKAHTNYYARALKTVLGLGGLSWEDLERVGIHKHDVPLVEFASAEKIEGDWVTVRVPYSQKDQLKSLVRKYLNVTPKFDSAQKGWVIPRAALDIPEIRDLVQQ